MQRLRAPYAEAALSGEIRQSRCCGLRGWGDLASTSCSVQTGCRELGSKGAGSRKGNIRMKDGELTASRVLSGDT